MSNQAVGNVYQTIIEEVINSSRVDFEESGVEEAVLEELRLGWQQKLSQLDVARFPWDPKPEPAPPAASAPAPNTATPVQTQAQFSTPLSLPTASPPGGLPQNGIKQESYVKPEPGIKQEPGAQQPGLYQNYNGMENKNSVAANRAAQQLQAQYGMRAAGSINAIQDRMGQQPQGQQPGQGSAPVLPQQPQQMPHPSEQSMGNAQVDGAGDDMMEDSDDDEETFEGILLRNGVNGNPEELGRVDIDRILHDQIAAKAKSMEGGGLMLSLKEATKNQPKSSAAKKLRSKGKAPAGVAAYDGGDDDEDIDEDAINSDLDDPDEDRDDDEVDDEGLGHIMLCMYDKVQRVKNKWKCTLKDGVLTVNGKEYVFNKATGEYEW
ncbi:transcription factor IIA, alpha/beta subunit domain-containing protein [Trichoderma breve]|uniref:Transcription initiation factor IIA large subunit n=1 Tax=Trichoderma breve TaxID=2034170 RepID=A0A9W9E9Y6_9HYPO|nr:transcription factor IIA, alpha/beta subunit domain-containing protein [Trichoderma breve]KAJ4862897.1 transcription factor IIA, alpha/beta subunit domain-containing protein [Trichoderma breve]